MPMKGHRKVRGKLTVMQERFCQEYMKDLNGSAAAVRAGASPTNARRLATRWLRLVHIRSTLDELRAQNTVHARITTERILEEYERVAFFDPSRMYTAEGRLLSVPQMPEDVRRAIAGVEVELEQFTTKVRLVSKEGALNSLSKHKQLFPNESKTVVPPGGTGQPYSGMVPNVTIVVLGEGQILEKVGAAK